MRKFKMILFLLILMAFCVWGGKIFLSGDRISAGKGQEMSYEICKKGHIPKNLKTFIETAKKSPCCFTLKDSQNLYIVICYGEKKYAGYSIQVKQFEEKKGVLRIKTNLKGPSNTEPEIRKKNWPYLVLKCKSTDALCIIEP